MACSSEASQYQEGPRLRERYFTLPTTPTESITRSTMLRHKAIGMVEKSLLAQRPTNRAIIFLYGLSGSGKTSTLKHLFHGAEEMMETSFRQSATCDIIEYISSMESDHWEAQNLEISWVDAPGFADTGGPHMDAHNLVLIEEFIARHPQLGVQQLKWFGMTYNYIVYPNIVMIVVDVNDERMLGTESKIATMFSIVKKKRLHLLDRKHPNVVIVLTHVCSMPPKAWKTRLVSKTYFIKLLARRFFKIEVPVIYIENDFSDHELEVVGDFTLLHNGEEQPRNLFEACINLMRNNQDEIGIEAVRLFFKKNRRESLNTVFPNVLSYNSIASDNIQFAERRDYFYKKITFLKPQFQPTAVSNAIDDYIKHNNDPENDGLNLGDELYPLKFLLVKRGLHKPEEIMSKSLADLEIFLLPYKLNQIELRILTFLFNVKPPAVQNISTQLGRGYDLMKQNIIDKPIVCLETPVSLPPYGFLIPGSGVFEFTDELNFFCNYYHSRAEMTRELLEGYGLGNYKDLLSFAPSPGYNIVVDDPKKTVQVTFLIEKTNLSIRIDPKTYKFTQTLLDILKDVPQTFDQSNKADMEFFKKLFTKFGGCIITKVGIGGYVQGKFEVSSEKTQDSSYFQYLRQWLIPLIMGIKSGLSVEDMVMYARDIEEEIVSPLNDLLRAELEWFGGDSRHYQSTLRDISHRQWTAWEESTNYHPAILPSKIYPMPFFHLMSGSKATVIQEAFENICLNSPSLTLRTPSRFSKLFSKKSNTRAEVSEKAKSKTTDFNNICFPGSSTVLLSTGRVVCMRDLQIGDSIMSVDSEGRTCFSPLYLWGHLDPDRETEYLCISYRDGELRVSENHLVFVSRGEGRREPVPAGRVCVGDYLEFVCVSSRGVVRSVEVLSVSLIRDKGVYSPFTLNSCLVVDGILCSVFAVPETSVGDTRKAHERGHKIMAPIRLAYKSSLCNWVAYQMDDKKKMHFYCAALERMYYTFRPIEKLFQK